ncbi:ABC transporter substrate-binding protein [Ilumatobacter coccineus]|uniref:Putative branched-chain amino acid ABC transporter branched-chain amino acid-binding protein n=1 Tax=Ilumatobacter coccineus (strain NBRC 103263 / KCTC 29153 / YM16-304) TaxID=1313172 RepID=A0A6C7E6Q9_ILUCY|nr:ABC transporter substrate-binding protein [Ilumatobacter coccineus]BAN00865.1 putative branched-chain amino acid ABC transporter branched-chain amino acid-binding protein [Ilumatobacter coccineus YM16-304]
MKRTLKHLGVVCTLVIAAAACGSDDDASTSDDTAVATDPAETDAEPEATATTDGDTTSDDEAQSGDEAASTEASESTDTGDGDTADLAGDPVIVGFIGTTVGGSSSWDSSGLAFDAATAAVNDAGGIDGRPIEVQRCDDGGDPNVAVECMQTLIDDGAVAFVANYTQFGDAVNPEIIAAGHVVIGGFLFTGGDFGVPEVYATNGGAFVGGAGQFSACAAVGATGITAAYLDVPAGQQVPGLIEGVVKPAFPDVEFVSAEPLAVDLADFAPVAAKIISDGADCVMALSTTAQNNQLVQALRAQGFDGRITASGAVTTTAQAIADLGADADKMVIPHLYDHRSTGWDAYVAALAAVAPEQVPDDIGAGAWLSVLIAADVIAETGDDPAAITAGVTEVVVDYDTDGLTEAPLDWSVDGDNPLGLVNLRNVSSVPSEIIDGEEVISDAGFVSLFGG